MDGIHRTMKDQLHSPDEIGQQIWKELARACVDRHHEWRTPVLATTGPGGEANARTVVLRTANANSCVLEVYTDSRSAKVAELVSHPNAMLVFWSTRLKWQLRVRASIAVLAEGPHVQAVWQRVKLSASAGDYVSTTTPGAALQTNSDALAANASDPRSYFSILQAQVTEIDWLELARTGHRRAKIKGDCNGQGDGWSWLTP
jgi:pyridoxamine 5'-phosphate oxidase